MNRKHFQQKIRKRKSCLFRVYTRFLSVKFSYLSLNGQNYQFRKTKQQLYGTKKLILVLSKVVQNFPGFLKQIPFKQLQALAAVRFLLKRKSLVGMQSNI